MTGPDKPSRRRFLKGLGWASLAGGLLAGEAVREAYAFGVSHHTMPVRGLTEPLTIAFLADFHLGPYMGRRQLREWVDASNDLVPDLVVLGGDLVDRFYAGDLTELVAEGSRLTSRLGVVAVPGNHDRVRYPDLTPLHAAVQAAGASLLVNQGVRLREDLVVGGLDDLRRGSPDVGRTFQGLADGEGARVLVSHNPDVIPDLGPTAAAGRPIDLILCGHTHGGQVCLPFVGPLVTSSQYGARYAQGWVEAPEPAFVSRGLGVSLVPFRLLCAPELVFLELEPQ